MKVSDWLPSTTTFHPAVSTVSSSIPSVCSVFKPTHSSGQAGMHVALIAQQESLLKQGTVDLGRAMAEVPPYPNKEHKKEQQMRSSKRPIQFIVLALALALSSHVFGQDSSTLSQPQGAGDTARTRIIGEGQRLKIEGIVVKHNAGTFTLREPNGTETVVVLTYKTNVKMVRKGLFRHDRDTGVSYILRGLRLKAEGRGNTDGQLVAENIRFEEQDLRTAQE